jgi:hypothetical protein
MDNQQPSSCEETLEKVQRLENTVYGKCYDYESRRAVNTVRSAQPLTYKGEDIVYSMIERHSRKASEPTTTRSFTTSTLIFIFLRGTLAIGSLLLCLNLNSLANC